MENENNEKYRLQTESLQNNTPQKLKVYVAPKSTLLIDLAIEGGGQMMPESSGGVMS